MTAVFILLPNMRGSAFVGVRVMSDFYPYIPHTLKTSLVLSSLSLDISFEDTNTGYAAAIPLLYDQELVLYETIDPFLDTNSILKNNVPEPETQDACLSVPNKIDRSIIQLDKKLAAGDLADRLSAIQDYLSAGFIYDPEVTSIQSDKDFLSRFLFENKRGYCVHFATSFVILARIAGIPARYVTGFLVNSSASYEYPMEGEKTEEILSVETSMFREIFFGHRNPDKSEIEKMKKLLRALRKLK